MSVDRPVVVVFGSSRPEAGTEAYERAYELGYGLAEAGFAVANGGYGGTMEASARGARQANGHTIGVTCRAFKRSQANLYIEKEIITENLDVRLRTLVELGQGYVVLPGGTGTLLEIAMVWELLNKRLLEERPIIGLTDYWKPVVDLMLHSSEKFSVKIPLYDTYSEVIKELRDNIKIS